MCGRAALTASPDELREAFGLGEAPELTPHYNIVPSQPLAVVRTPGKLELLRWGLVPFWAKDTKIGHKLALARVETAATTPAFREAMRRRRCLVVVSGFYEWQRAGTSARQPFFARRDDARPFALAGVWERWVSKDGEVIESCAILTQPSRPPLDVVHDRMPIVLERDAWSRWLDPNAADAMAAPPEPGAAHIVSYAVSAHVNDPRHDDRECTQPAGEAQQQTLLGLDAR